MVKQTLITVALLGAALAACKGSTNPFFPADQGIPSDTQPGQWGSDSPTFENVQPNRWDKDGLSDQSISDSPDPEMVRRWALCISKVGECMVSYRDAIHEKYTTLNQDPEGPDAAGELRNAIANCERCGEVCAGFASLGSDNPWPMWVRKHDRPEPNRGLDAGQLEQWNLDRAQRGNLDDGRSNVSGPNYSAWRHSAEHNAKQPKSAVFACNDGISVGLKTWQWRGGIRDADRVVNDYRQVSESAIKQARRWMQGKGGPAKWFRRAWSQHGKPGVDHTTQ